MLDITIHTKEFEIRQSAYKIIGKENSQEAIIDIIKNGMAIDVQKAAIQKVSDQSVLVDITKNSKVY